MAEIEYHRLPASRVPMEPKLKLPPQHSLSAKVVAEFLGSFLLVLAISGLSATSQRTNGGVSLLDFAVCAAFTVTVIIFTTGHISGAHVNPAITIGFAFARRFSWLHVPVYVLAQLSASVVAVLAAKWIYSFPEDLALTKPLVGPFQSLAMETMMSSLVMFLACVLSSSSHLTGNAAAVAVPAVIGLSVMVAGPVSGASLNPARSLGPALVSNNYTSVWIYIVGPVVGSSIGVMIHKATLFTLVD